MFKKSTGGLSNNFLKVLWKFAIVRQHIIFGVLKPSAKVSFFKINLSEKSAKVLQNIVRQNPLNFHDRKKMS